MASASLELTIDNSNGGVWTPTKNENIQVTQQQSDEGEVRSSPLIPKARSIQLVPNFEEFLGFLIGDGIPEILAVLVGQVRNLCRVYIATDEFDFDINEKIYDREERIMDSFPDVEFDFDIITQFPSDPGLHAVFSR